MGRIRTKFIKNLGREIYEKYRDRFTTDFEKNKQIIKEILALPSKRLRNILAGYVTSLKKMESSK